MQHKNEENARENYEKPMLRKIDLAADEVLDVGCKSIGAPADTVSFCQLDVCFSTGS